MAYPCYRRSRHGGRPHPRGRRRLSIFGQVALELPGTDLGYVVAPLLPLCFQEVPDDMLAEGGRDQIVLFQLVERLVQIVWEIIDSEPPPLAKAHLPDVLV